MEVLPALLWSALTVILFLNLQAHGQTYAARTAIVNPDQGKSGVYRSLAQLAYQAYVEKNDGEAAVLAHILERVWTNERASLHTSSWETIDKSMERFARPLRGVSTGGGVQESNFSRISSRRIEGSPRIDTSHQIGNVEIAKS